MSERKQPVYAKLLTKTTINDDTTFYIEPLTVERFFRTTTKKVVPDYQRPYSWEDKNIKALLQDVKKVSEGKHESWFLGPLFTTKETPNSDLSSLLDGQQRITTIQIILREASVFSKTIVGLDLKEDFPKVHRGLKSVIENCCACIREIDDETVYPKFETESTIKNLFHDYIERFEHVGSLKDYKENVAYFEEKVAEESKKGSKTANNLSVARKIIRKFFEDEFDVSPINKGIEEFVGFMRSLLNKCWIIEVPLAKDDVSTKIFESLNNRGKSLTLTDKLRYKCLINCESEATKETIKIEWKKIYRGLDLCQPKFLKNDEDFFKIFFNAINAKSISDNDEIIEVFESKYINPENEQIEGLGEKIKTPPDSRIVKFIKECLKLLDFYENILINNLNENNSFIGSFPRDKQLRVKALIQLVKSLRFSDNSRFLLFIAVLKRHEIGGKENYALLQDLWALVRITFFIETLDKKNSNTIRNNFLKIISETEIISNKPGKAWSLHKYFIDKKETEYNLSRNLLNDVLIANDSSEAKFVLYLYAFLNEYVSLCSHGADQYKEHHVEHLFPVVWQVYWREKNFSKNDIDEFLKTIKPEQFPALKADEEETKTLKVVNEIRNKEQLELFLSKQAKQKDTLIQFIGNKWVIHSASNISAKNYSLKEKKEKFKPNHYVKIPSNTNKQTGLDLYNDFGYKEIITRSLTIVNDIFMKFHNNWDDS